MAGFENVLFTSTRRHRERGASHRCCGGTLPPICAAWASVIAALDHAGAGIAGAVEAPVTAIIASLTRIIAGSVIRMAWVVARSLVDRARCIVTVAVRGNTILVARLYPTDEQAGVQQQQIRPANPCFPLRLLAEQDACH